MLDNKQYGQDRGNDTGINNRTERHKQLAHTDPVCKRGIIVDSRFFIFIGRVAALFSEQTEVTVKPIAVRTAFKMFTNGTDGLGTRGTVKVTSGKIKYYFTVQTHFQVPPKASFSHGSK